MDNKQSSVNMQLATVLWDRREKNVWMVETMREKNVLILEAIIETISLYRRQNIVLMGNRDDSKYDQKS